MQRIRAFDEDLGFLGIQNSDLSLFFWGYTPSYVGYIIQNSDLVIQIALIYLVFLLIQWPNAGV